MPEPLDVREPCDPYPHAFNLAASEQHPDHRRSAWLTEVLDGLDAGELRDLARLLGVLHPREFEQELFWIQRMRNQRAALDRKEPVKPLADA